MDGSIFAGASPWQQWGNTQLLTVPADLFTNPNVHEQQVTLLRVQYNRPETWRFLFSARIVSAPVVGALEQANAGVWFELITGIGRSAMRIPFWVTLPSWTWNFGAAVPNLVFWTNQAPTSDVSVSVSSDVVPISVSSQIFSDLIVGQDISVVAHAVFNSDAVAPAPAVIEVSGHFAPNVHVRPDWLQVDAPPSEQFSGGELKGR